MFCPECGRSNKPTAKFCIKCGYDLKSEGGGVKSKKAEIEPGVVLDDRYEILNIIEKGGMGAVYKAKDHRLDIVCAVKEMRENFEREEYRLYAIDKFKSEALILSKLRHPNIPRVSDYFIENNRYYLVMDFIKGETLLDIMERRSVQRVEEDELIEWTVQLCDVLSYLHNQDPPIIYRDIKPANVMIDADGRIFLIDFGIARIFNPRQKGTMIGTQGYSPPEQYRGKVEPRSDLYALGATMHHLVTGRDPQLDAPFSFEPVKKIREDISDKLAYAIDKCLKFKIAERFESVEEVKNYLEGKTRTAEEIEESIPELDLDAIPDFPEFMEPEPEKKNQLKKTVSPKKKSSPNLTAELEQLLFSIEEPDEKEEKPEPDITEQDTVETRIASEKPREQKPPEPPKNASHTMPFKPPVAPTRPFSPDSLKDVFKSAKPQDEIHIKKPGLPKEQPAQKREVEIPMEKPVNRPVKTPLEKEEEFSGLSPLTGSDSPMLESMVGGASLDMGSGEPGPGITEDSLWAEFSGSNEEEKPPAAAYTSPLSGPQLTGRFEPPKQTAPFTTPPTEDDGEIHTGLTGALDLDSPHIKAAEENFKTSEMDVSGLNKKVDEKPAGKKTLPVLASWFMNRANREHTGYNGQAKNCSGKLKWRFRTSGRIYASAVQGNDRTTYFGSDDGCIYAINSKGKEKWRFVTDDNIRVAPLVIDNVGVFFGSVDGNFYAVDLNGAEKWKVKLGGAVFSSAALGLEGVMYAGCNDGSLYAFTPDGNVKWTFKIDNFIYSSPAVGEDGTIYVGSWDKNLYAINPMGNLQWKFKAGDVIDSSPALDKNGNIYFGCSDGNVYCVDYGGRVKWKYKTHDAIISSPAIHPEKGIYIGSDDNFLYHLNFNGKLRWKFRTDFYVKSSPAVDRAGNVYFGSGDFNIYALSPDGREVWKFKTNAAIESSPCLGDHGTLLTGSNDGWLSALQ